MTARILFGFHAVGVRLETAPRSVLELHVDPARRDARMQHFVARAVEAASARREQRRPAGAARRLARHQGVVARVEPLAWPSRSTTRSTGRRAAAVLVLDGVTDPHNLGACLRVADGAGAHAVLAPKDHAVGLNATVAKVASGAAETVPYFMVTNLARTLNELKERDIRVVGTAEDAPRSIYELDLAARWRWCSAPRARACASSPPDLRRARPPADARRGREPQRLGRQRHLPVRSGAAAPSGARR
jgi:23S rRNA (guanosine2251-2'-O)-methyltransferase